MIFEQANRPTETKPCSNLRNAVALIRGNHAHRNATNRAMKFMTRSASYSLFATTLTIVLGASTAPAGNVSSIPANVTFTENVAPILFQNCARCHRPGEVAPFSLLNFQDAKKHARQIADVTESRFMPPWHAGHGYVEFSNERRITDEQIALLGAWVQQG